MKTYIRSITALVLLSIALLTSVEAQNSARKGAKSTSSKTTAQKEGYKTGDTKKKKGDKKADIEDCDIPFEGSDRKAIKLRSAAEKYPVYNKGKAISVGEFYQYVSGLIDGVPSQRKLVPEDKLQISETKEWKELSQLVVEIPPGKEYCEARDNYIKLIEAQPKGTPKKCIFTNPPYVEVTGYLFLDAAHMRNQRTDYATDNGGRGIRDEGMKTSPVRGIWELHPVIKLEAVKK